MGWVIAKAAGLVDSLKVVQAALSDFVGDYVQTAKMRDANRNLVRKTSNVRIEATGTNKANFIVDNKYTWPVDFIPGKGFKMTMVRWSLSMRCRLGFTNTTSLSSWLMTLVRSTRRLSMVRRRVSSWLLTMLVAGLQRVPEAGV